MGRIIGAAKAKLGSSADPSQIAQVVNQLIKGE
jgi:chorismate mutase